MCWHACAYVMNIVAAKYKHPETDLDENYEHSGPTIRIPPNRSAASQKTISSFGLSERSRRLSARARKNDTALGGLTVVREDMRIDPNEPRYCFCNGVSWGEVRNYYVQTENIKLNSGKMIGCDSGRCELEWVMSYPVFTIVMIVYTGFCSFI